MSQTSTPSGEANAPLVMDEQPAKRRLADNQPTTFMEKVKDNIYYMRGRGALEIGLIYVALLAFYLVLYSTDSAGFPFFSSQNLTGTITQAIPTLALLAIGVGVLMVAGEFDLSVGFVLSFAGIVFIKVAEQQGWVAGFFAAVLAATCAHTINGLITVYTRIPSFIATLGMGFVWKGASIYAISDMPAVLIQGRTETFTKIFAGDFGFFRAQLVWLLVLGAIAWFLLHRHRAGNKVYAVGGNAAAAKAVSIKPNIVKLQSFAFLGVMVGIVSVLIAARSGSMQPTSTENMTLLAIAAAVVGGCSLTGGRGTIIGMVLGAAIIQSISNGLLLANAPGFYQEAFLGVAIVVAAIFNKFMEGKAT
jgi:simple sugar transport system permease protein